MASVRGTPASTTVPVSVGANCDIGNGNGSVLVPPSADGEAITGRALSLKLDGGPLLHGGLVHVRSGGRLEGYLKIDDVAGIF